MAMRQRSAAVAVPLPRTGAPRSWRIDREQLGVLDRIELFLAVCEGVEHAHRKGILHDAVLGSREALRTLWRSLVILGVTAAICAPSMITAMSGCGARPTPSMTVT